MQHNETTFSDARNVSIYTQSWVPDTPPRALLLVAHGAAEHSGRYQQLAEYFVAQGFAVAALDHIGHGRSGGDRCYIEQYEDFIDTLRLFHLRVQEEFSGVPIFLLGHSMGGLIGTSYLLQYQADLAGCILSGPAIMSETEPGRLQLWLIKALSRLWPRLRLLQLDAEGVSRNPEEVERYRLDELVYTGRLPARTVRELFVAMETVKSQVTAITLPILLLHGGEDSMTAPEGSEFLNANISSTDKTLKIYPGLFHEIFNEPEREQVMADALNWCTARLQADSEAIV